LAKASWSHEEGNFEGARGTQIYYQAWTPAAKLKALIVLAHGIGEHSGRYAHVADYMARNDFALWACDHRGHGRSGGKRGHVESFDDYIVDIDHLARIAKDRSPSNKAFLMGLSLGGLIAAYYAEKHPAELAGLVVSGPALAWKMKVPPAKVMIAKILSGIVPTFSIDTGLDPNLLSHDGEVVRKYVEDPMVHKVVTARWGTEFLRAQDETMLDANKLTLPCLVLQGGADGIVDPDATSRFFKRIGSADKTLKVYETFYHEVLNEPGKESVLGDISTWLSARS